MLENYALDYSYREKLDLIFKDLGRECSYTTGQVIETGSSRLDHIYYIKSGLVEQCFLSPGGKKKTLLLLESGDILGEVSLIQKDLDMVVTEATRPSKLVKIPSTSFFNKLEEDPGLSMEVLTMMTTKMRNLMFQIYDLSYYEKKIQLYNLLKRLSIQHGSLLKEGTLIDLDLTHYKLANMINSTRSTVTKILKELDMEGKIGRLGSNIVVY